MTRSGISIGVLASGSLGLTGIKAVVALAPVSFVFTNRKSFEITEYCRDLKIPCYVGNPRNGQARSFLGDHPVDIILSINYLFLVDHDVLQHPRILAANFHGSLLPKYRGRTPHVWAIINNETVTGVTAHLMEPGCDTGDILLQRDLAIETNDTGATMLEKFHSIYPCMIRDLLASIEDNNVSSIPQNHSKATSYGARSPEDGRICWDWFRERIYNWIRAQAHPYPGAFFLIDGQRFVVNESRLSDCGFDFEVPNGTVLSRFPLVVKTPNGAIELTEHCLPASLLTSTTQTMILE